MTVMRTVTHGSRPSFFPELAIGTLSSVSSLNLSYTGGPQFPQVYSCFCSGISTYPMYLELRMFLAFDE